MRSPVFLALFFLITFSCVSCTKGPRYKVIETEQGTYILDKKRAESYKVNGETIETEAVQKLPY